MITIHSDFDYYYYYYYIYGVSGVIQFIDMCLYRVKRIINNFKRL